MAPESAVFDPIDEKLRRAESVSGEVETILFNYRTEAADANPQDDDTASDACGGTHRR
jgi:hypothetical protein